MVEDEQRSRLWHRTARLAAIVVGALTGLAVVLPLAAPSLDAFRFLGFPLGAFLLVQGFLIALVVAAFWFAAYQERVDRRHGAVEDM